MRVIAFIPCEDIREEKYGKNTLVGCFDGLSILPGQAWPIGVRVASHLKVIFDSTERLPNESGLRVLINGEELVGARSPFAVTNRDRPVVLNAPMVILPMKAPGVIVFEYSFFSDGEQIGDPLRFEIPVSRSEEHPT